MRTLCATLLAGTGLVIANLFSAVAWAALPGETTAGASPAKRPKICLVLSGGGARGAAHIGVLRVLEQYRVPIHCIAGTSMGAIAGGAFASGTTVADVERMVRAADWNYIFYDSFFYIASSF